MGFVLNPLYGTFDIDKGHGDILAPSAASNNQIAIFTDPTHIIGATGNGLAQSTGGIFGVIATGAINATAPLTISGVGKAVGGSVNAVITTGNISVNSSVLALTGGTAASLAQVTLGWIVGTTAQFLRGDATWANFPAILTTGSLVVSSPLTATGETTGVILGAGAQFQVNTGNITTTSPIIGITGGTAASLTPVTLGIIQGTTAQYLRGDGSWQDYFSVTGTGNILFTSPIVVSGNTTGALLGDAATFTVTTGNINASSPITITGAGKAVGGSVNAVVTTANLTVASPVVASATTALLLAPTTLSINTANLTVTAPVVASATTALLLAPTTLSITTGGVTVSAPVVFSGVGVAVAGSMNFSVTTGNINGTGCTITGAGKAVGGSVNIAVSAGSATVRAYFESTNVLGGSVNFVFATTLNAPYIGLLAVVNTGSQIIVPDFIYWGANNVAVGLTSFVSQITAAAGSWSVAYSIPSA
jgi:hypothetical protein